VSTPQSTHDPRAGRTAVADAPVVIHRSSKRVLWSLAAILIFFALLEGIVFHTDLYPSIVEPDSTTGFVETQLRNEIARSKPNRNQVLAVGHSRMALMPRIANELTGETGYTFASVAVGGTTARCWYYELRAVDPHANRYAAIVIPSDDYDEPDEYDSHAEREADLHYVIARIGLADLWEFSRSYESRRLQYRAAASILFKGFTFKRDFADFLKSPKKRLAKVRLTREHSADWFYNYVGHRNNLAGMSIDWQQRTIDFPDRFTQEQRDLIRRVMLPQVPPRSGKRTEFLRHWYNRIADHYQGSGTKLIFLRVARGPLIPPVSEPSRMDTAVRQMAARPEVVLIDEHFFDRLERPELFGDPLHLNQDGVEEFSRMLARETRRIVGPAR
jgi:hypothetical protein